MGAEKRRDIQRIIFVLGSAILCAIALAVYMVHYHSPALYYLAKNTLISPQVAREMKIPNHNSQTGKKDWFILSGMEFTYVNQENVLQHIQVEPETYEKFYEMVSNEKSLETVPEGVIHLFNPNRSSALIVNVKLSTQSKEQALPKTFQVIQFASEGDYYRVQLIGQDRNGEWAYFYHSHIYQDTMHLFRNKA